jgi:hypothetical protein
LPKISTAHTNGQDNLQPSAGIDIRAGDSTEAMKQLIDEWIVPILVSLFIEEKNTEVAMHIQNTDKYQFGTK